jgi:thymidine kinase
MGYLELILGPMFSGKSSRLIQIIRKYKILNHSILVIKPVIDKRYSENSEIVTHDKISEKCVTCSTLSEIKDVDKYQVIIIEEGQFFIDLYENVTEWCKNKRVYVAGLNGGANKELFGNIYKLLPHVDEITFLKALCKICNDGTLAVFTKKTISNNNLIEIGGEELYTAVCRDHFKGERTKKTSVKNTEKIFTI